MTSQIPAQTASERQSGLWTETRMRLVKALPALLAGAGGFLTIYLLSDLTSRLDVTLLIAPFGASCVLVFGLPQSPLAQPRNVIGGHLISSAVGLASLFLFGATPLAFGLGVGVAITAMLMTRTTHPPAGADPIVVILVGATWQFLLTPVLLGTIAIAAMAYLYHRFVTRMPYPHVARS